MSITVSRVSYVESRNMFETQASKISLYLGDKRNKLRVCKSFLVDYFTVHITGICSTKINVEILNTKRQQHNRHTHTHTAIIQGLFKHVTQPDLSILTC